MRKKKHTVHWGFAVKEHETARYAAQICEGGRHGGYHRPATGRSGVICSPCEEKRAG